MAKSNDIVVIGELNVDLIASGVNTGPVLGTEVLAADFNIALGSASAIFACGIARLGHSVTFVSRIGNDDFGHFCLESLVQRGIATDHIEIDVQSKTGVTVVISTAEDRSMVTFLGAIAELSLTEVPANIFQDNRHLHLTSYYLQKALQSDFPYLLDSAKAAGATTSFDPNSDPDQGRDEKVLEVCRHADILFLNEDEAKLLADTGDIEEAGRYLNGLSPTVAIKLGAKGAIGFRDNEIERVEGFKIDAVDSTGAGDSFAAGFVHAFLEGSDLKTCLKIGNACGAFSASRPGGTDGQADREELERFLMYAALRT
ncbi:MAG: carbohydrate kinase family protein [Acidobacteria bacterium]|nr:carbohydrate kinase family protein [Acidobacteriota bacterium]HMU33457.1 carbohydrate kinase family protein [Pyrinomonadaceae bacterium]